MMTGRELSDIALQTYGADWRKQLAAGLGLSQARVSQLVYSAELSERSTRRIMELFGQEGEVKQGIRVFNKPVNDEDSLTDTELLERINKRFEVMDRLSDGLAAGTFRSMIVAGAPGVGKSHNLEHKLRDVARNTGKEYFAMRGTCSAPGLYQMLYRARDGIVVIDDCDSVFQDEQAFNILKAALDTTQQRVISWRKQSMWVYDAAAGEEEDPERFPNEFEFNGAVVFITNLNFREIIAQEKKLAPHFKALMSRSMYLDLTLHSQRARLLRIRDVFSNKMAISYGLTPTQSDEILDYVEQHAERFDELSLRLMVHVAQSYLIGDDWRELIEMTKMA